MKRILTVSSSHASRLKNVPPAVIGEKTEFVIVVKIHLSYIYLLPYFTQHIWTLWFSLSSVSPGKLFLLRKCESLLDCLIFIAVAFEIVKLPFNSRWWFVLQVGFEHICGRFASVCVMANRRLLKHNKLGLVYLLSPLLLIISIHTSKVPLFNITVTYIISYVVLTHFSRH